LAERTMNYVETETVPARGRGTRAGGHVAPPERPRTVAQRSPTLLRRVNQVMRDGRRGQTELEYIPFFCECQRDDCYEPVWLTADAYDERRAETRRPLILPGHEYTEKERRRARR
jgi:hypothetical protein